MLLVGCFPTAPDHSDNSFGISIFYSPLCCTTQLRAARSASWASSASDTKSTTRTNMDLGHPSGLHGVRIAGLVEDDLILRTRLCNPIFCLRIESEAQRVRTSVNLDDCEQATFVNTSEITYFSHVFLFCDIWQAFCRKCRD